VLRFLMVFCMMFYAVSAFADATAHSYIHDFFVEFKAKLDQIQNVDQENEVLRKRIAELEIQNAELAEKRLNHHEKEKSEHLKAEAKTEGGLETSRTIASLKAADDNLISKPPKAIYQSGVKYFESEDYESAAKAFALLVENKENDAYQTAPVFYFAAVSLYKLKNYKKSAQYFEWIIHNSKKQEVSFAPRSMSWLALCYAKLGNKKAEKQVVRELLEKFPKSKEARRLNRDA
jgi:TolA-binding protein